MKKGTIDLAVSTQTEETQMIGFIQLLKGGNDVQFYKYYFTLIVNVYYLDIPFYRDNPGYGIVLKKNL